MKKLITILALAALLSNCKDNNDPEPLPEIAPIAARWQLTQTEYKRGDSTVIYAEIETEPHIIAFRYDGMVTNALGYAPCCPPSSYIINGVPFVIRPIGEAPQLDPNCGLVDCVSCPEWKITHQGDSLEIESCLNTKSKYVRVK